jgi:hypothetical protein
MEAINMQTKKYIKGFDNKVIYRDQKTLNAEVFFNKNGNIEIEFKKSVYDARSRDYIISVEFLDIERAITIIGQDIIKKLIPYCFINSNYRLNKRIDLNKVFGGY